MGATLNAIMVLMSVAFAAYIYYLPLPLQDDEVRGKAVLITGASSGIGEELALQYAKLGAKLLLTARREKLIQKVAKRCQEAGATSVNVLKGDMTDARHRDKLVAEAERRLGGLDHLVLNHGDYNAASWLGTSQNLTNLEMLMNANFMSHVDMASRAMPLLTASSGRIGVVSSLAAKVPVPLMAAYSASKAALQSFFASLRQELHQKSSNVTVTTFLLGTITTEKYAGVLERNFHWINEFLAASVQEAAVAIIRGIEQRQAEVTYPVFAQLQQTMYTVIPEIYEFNWHHLSK